MSGAGLPPPETGARPYPAVTGSTDERAGDSLFLRLPATSANLGPGFDAAALALALFLEIEARPAPEFRIEAGGRDAEVCSALTGNLLLQTYADVWKRHGTGVPRPLHLTVRNGIPLGMGCGSSAASRLAAIALASHFAGLGWSRASMLDEAAALEHHPDNVAACCLGGLAVAARVSPDFAGPAAPPLPVDVEADGEAVPPAVQALSLPPPHGWHALLVLPAQALATTTSRAVLPRSYPRADVVANLQSLALLVAAFASGDPGFLRVATGDRLHQPYRAQACPLLPRLLPLAGRGGILSVTLSGAGSGVLLLLREEGAVADAMAQVHAAAADPIQGSLPVAELLPCALAYEGAVLHARFAQPVLKNTYFASKER